MISKIKIKLIKSLSQKKYRIKENLFLAEGNKITNAILSSGMKVQTLICTEEFLKTKTEPIAKAIELIVASKDEIRKCSLLKNPQQALVLCEIPNREFEIGTIKNSLMLCLENIQDPGNLGTILRIADWFGITSICASSNTVDVFNPKVVQASMGSVINVKVYYTNLPEIIQEANSNAIPVFGTFLNGNNIYKEKLPGSGLIILGNEGNGISENLEPLIKNRLYIPSVKTVMDKGNESLNVSIATAIICSEFRRVSLASIQSGNLR